MASTMGETGAAHPRLSEISLGVLAALLVGGGVGDLAPGARAVKFMVWWQQGAGSLCGWSAWSVSMPLEQIKHPSSCICGLVQGPEQCRVIAIAPRGQSLRTLPPFGHWPPPAAAARHFASFPTGLILCTAPQSRPLGIASLPLCAPEVSHDFYSLRHSSMATAKLNYPPPRRAPPAPASPTTTRPKSTSSRSSCASARKTSAVSRRSATSSTRRCAYYARSSYSLLQEPGSYVGEIVAIMGRKKVLVKVHPEGKYVVDIDKNIAVEKLNVNDRVALRNDSYTLHLVLPSKVDPLVSLMKVEKVPDSTYDMVGGCDKQIKEIKEVIELPIKHPELFESLGIAQPKGVLMYGPPGTGKTLLARAVAHHTDCTFIRVSGGELVQKYIGEGSRMVRAPRATHASMHTRAQL